jgi:hypothetical protein
MDMSRARLNKATMQEIKRAAAAFKEDVGFVPDNVSLLIFPYETCGVHGADFNESNVSSACQCMIAFVDSRLSMSAAYRDTGEGDYGEGMVRTDPLIAEIGRRLDVEQGGWRGSYIGGNAHLIADHNQTYQWFDGKADVRFFLGERDLDLYYDGFSDTDTLNDIGVDEATALSWYPIAAGDFNGSRGSGNIEPIDRDYDIAKYRSNLYGELTILDPWGTPYEIQFPISVPSGKTRERYARIVSFGPDRLRNVNVSELDAADYGDDSVLYVYEHNLSSHFHVPKS